MKEVLGFPKMHAKLLKNPSSVGSVIFCYILNLVFARLEILNSGLLCTYCHILVMTRN